MARDQDLERAAEQYRRAALLLTRNMSELRRAHVPVDPEPDGTPPAWTPEQRELVFGAAWSWWCYARARGEYDALVDPATAAVAERAGELVREQFPPLA